MAQEETNIANDILKGVSPTGTRLFKNVRGSFYTLDTVKELINSAMSLVPARIKSAIAALRRVMAGLQVPGSSDLIGFTPKLITPEMVGKTIAIFTAIEVKTPTGRIQPDQQDFVNYIQRNGGIAGIARSREDALKIIEKGG